MRRFRLTCEPITAEGPFILIPNHVTAWDPLIVAMALHKKHVYFVASEHIFRWGLLSRIIKGLVDPIPRSKGTSGADTARSCLRHLKAGHSICLFAEGEQSWDGLSRPVAKGTGNLVRHAKVTLVTYRLQGGYLSLPRWGKGLRKGSVKGCVAGVYTPDDLKDMSGEEINALIDRDIYENAFESQKKDPVRFIGKRPAEYLERLLYVCPSCRKISTLKSEGDRLFCVSCGLECHYTDAGFFDSGAPFSQTAEWESWQKDALRELVRSKEGYYTEPAQAEKDGTREPAPAKENAPEEALFEDGPVILKKITADHGETVVGEGLLVQYTDRFVCAGKTFYLTDISEMAMTQYKVLLFTAGKDYYEIKAGERTNLRKYLEVRLIDSEREP